jgi:hypothetical protein
MQTASGDCEEDPYVIHDRAHDYGRLRWIIEETMQDRHDGEYSILMEWLCACAVLEARKKSARKKSATRASPGFPGRVLFASQVCLSERVTLGRISSFGWTRSRNHMLDASLTGCVQVFGRRNDETDHALKRPATKKRQGTKSRAVGQWLAAGAMGI